MPIGRTDPPHNKDVVPVLAIPRPCVLDGCFHFSYPEVMEVHFTPELQAKLDRIAADIHSGADEYVQLLVEQYVDHDVWFRRRVAGSLEQLDRGEFLTHEQVGARMKKAFQP